MTAVVVLAVAVGLYYGIRLRSVPDGAVAFGWAFLGLWLLALAVTAF